MSNTEKIEVVPFDLIPNELAGIKLNEEIKERLSRGYESPFFKDMVTSEGEVIDGKISLDYDKEKHELTVHYNKKEPVLTIPDTLFGEELSEEQMQALFNNETMGPIIIGGKEFYVNIDEELNKVVIKTSYEIGIPDVIGGYALDDIEKNSLSRGVKLDTKIFEKDGVYFSARISLSRDHKGLVFEELKEVSKNRVDFLKEQFNIDKVSKEKMVDKQTLLIGKDISKDYVNEVKNPQNIVIKESIDKVSKNNVEKSNKQSDYQRESVQYKKFTKLDNGRQIEANKTFVKNHIYGARLTKKQKEDLKQGKSVLISGMRKEGKFNGNFFEGEVTIKGKTISFLNEKQITYKPISASIEKGLGFEK